MTIIFVTHEADIAAHARRVLTIRDGLISSDERRTPAGATTTRGLGLVAVIEKPSANGAVVIAGGGRSMGGAP